MRKRQLVVAVAAVSAVLAGAIGATVAVAEPAAEARIDEKLVEQRLEALADVTDAAVVAEVRAGDEVWTEAHGTRQDGGDEAAEPSDRARIASVTKSMVTTVALQLVGERELALDDSIHNLAPGLLPYEDAITIRQLLGHTAGVPDFFIDIYPSLGEGSPEDLDKNRLNEYTPAEIVETATERPLDFEPGSKYQYSNTGYYVIGLLIERLTGNTVEDEVENRVLEPADMDDTYLPETDPTIDGDHLDAYVEIGKKPGDERIDTSAVSPTQFWAAGAAVSNPADMNRLFRSMFDGTLLSEDLLDEARDFSEQSKGEYGLGLQALPAECEAVDGGTAMGHTGGGLGHTTFSFHSPDGETQVSFTFATDPQGLPAEQNEKVYGAVVDLTLAGLCGDESAKVNGEPLEPLDNVTKP